MQQSRGSIGMKKHRKAFGKGNRNPRNNRSIAKEMNALSDEAARMRDRRKSDMAGSVRELFHPERERV